MSHTNATSNYNLPQFLGSDKPAWLGDINPAMSAIDTQMKANADASTTAGTNATTALNGIGTLANLTTTEKTNLVGAVNEIDTELGTVSGVASSASGAATIAKNTADTLSDYVNIDTYGNATATTSNGSIAYVNFSYASNEDATVGKIYGYCTSISSSIQDTTITIAGLPFRPSADIAINGVAYAQDLTNGEIFPTTLNVKTDGTATITYGSAFYNRTMKIIITACILFIKSFGDVPIES